MPNGGEKFRFPAKARRPFAIVGYSTFYAQILADARIAHPLALGPETGRHAAQARRFEGKRRRNGQPEQLCGIGHDILRRGRLVIADVIDAVPGILVDRRRQDPRDVFDMDAIEHLARLDDAPGRAGLEMSMTLRPGP
ncbi:MAG: hypothetical protein HC869_23690 [Rhodospirillales bacterium]|nr:hypothetical protein [Rhodospirillales bacterium]